MTICKKRLAPLALALLLAFGLIVGAAPVPRTPRMSM